MPHSATAPSLPFAGSLDLTARACSRAAAEAKASRFGARTRQYLAWLRHIGLCTDAGAAESIPMPLQSICSVRNAVMARGLVESEGTTTGRWGLAVTVYKLTRYGRVVADTIADDAGGLSLELAIPLVLTVIVLVCVGVAWPLVITGRAWLVVVLVLALAAGAALLRSAWLSRGDMGCREEDEVNRRVAWERLCREVRARRTR